LKAIRPIKYTIEIFIIAHCGCSYLEAVNETLEALPDWRQAHENIQRRVHSTVARLEKCLERIKGRGTLKKVFNAKEDQVRTERDNEMQWDRHVLSQFDASACTVHFQCTVGVLGVAYLCWLVLAGRVLLTPSTKFAFDFAVTCHCMIEVTLSTLDANPFPECFVSQSGTYRYAASYRCACLWLVLLCFCSFLVLLFSLHESLVVIPVLFLL
jgi:hypothetical protein